MKHALVTGSAGFIGSHLVDSLLADGWHVTGIDSFDAFYDPEIKRRNVKRHLEWSSFTLIEADIRDKECLEKHLTGDYDVIVHLAARAGVRPSLVDPVGYFDVNVNGTQILLDLAREWGTKQFVFASSSSVYGLNPNVPWSEEDNVLLPISPYASTKVCGELMGHVYSHLYNIRFVALRFFTVYGPRQRPDLAIHKFARLLLEDQFIPVYGDGLSRRDYTYVSDIVAGIQAAMRYDRTRYEVINLGNNQAISLMEMVQTLENVLGRKAKLRFLPAQAGDVPQTWADIAKAQKLLGYNPQTSFEHGMQKFADWLTSELPI